MTTLTDHNTDNAPPRLDGSLSPSDLAELMASFNEVTARLERTHSQLQGEVGRLNTELRQANEALQRSKRLAALGEMAAGISHEIRNPLGSIRLYAKMLEEDLAEMPEQRSVAEKIARAVRGLDGIVTDVLAFARELRVHKTPSLVSDLIEVSVESCRSQLEGIEVRCKGDDARIECDSGMIQQALVNIIRNACDASRASGGSAILIETAQGDELDEQSVVLRVRDEGDGMPAEVVERMFNPFFTTRATGTGLGLAIVHRMIDAHAGRVVVYNNSDRGSQQRGATVELHLPIGASEQEKTEERSETSGEIVVRAQSGDVLRV
jgi:two-component system sensor histidine kinase FlrB